MNNNQIEPILSVQPRLIVRRISIAQYLAISFLAIGIVGVKAAAQDVDFGKQIRPILSKNCLACHGPDESNQDSDLRLDNFESATDWAIVPGAPDDSEVMARILSEDEGYVMPPPEHGHALTVDEIDLIRKWIKSGAEYTQHWSFIKPVAAEPPSSKFDAWTHNEIDRFIARRLESLGLTPSQVSEPHRLIRRVALDLTGLPPTPEQVQKYVDDPTPVTYEKIVDELLGSRSYGEHWAAMWMDIARYADTFGYASDDERTIWPWRDWAIQAFNNNMPYDQFTIEQLAGDLLPNPTDSQLLATAFHRNTLNNAEGGTNDEEFRTIAVKDRINTTVNVWMGLTMRCAECHTHKYDPISQTEYYQFLDFFNQTADADKNDESPRVGFSVLGRKSALADLETKIARLKKEIAGQPGDWSVLQPISFESPKGTTFKALEDHSVLATGGVPLKDEYVLTFRLPSSLAGKVLTGLRIEAIPDPSNEGNVGRSMGGNFVINQITAKLVEGESQTALVFSEATADYSQPEYGIEMAIRDVVDDKGWAVGGASDNFSNRREAILDFKQPVSVNETGELRIDLLQQSDFARHVVGRVRISATTIAKPAQMYRDGKLDRREKKLAELTDERNRLADKVLVPIMKELPVDQKRTTHVMIRGSFLAPGDAVSAAVPAAFNPLPSKASHDRLGVAKWIVDEDNPLTARVTVNRFWARIFGIGIVETEEDFGTQGTLPTHGELLDWLAVDFRAHGWNVKRLLKQFVMSATYRQSNRATVKQLADDPRNLFYSRGPRIRLSAEVVRDQALVVSGLFSDAMYGPPVFPPNPVKRVVSAFTGGMTWTVSQGGDRYRRAIYTYLKRSQPHPLFDTFDMATREICSMRRLRTNTPLQSFMTLNDETFIECAQSLAHHMQEQGDDVDQQIKFGLEAALLRPADEEQVAALKTLYGQAMLQFSTDAKAAKEMAGKFAKETATDLETAELASQTVVANVILNLDSFLTK